MTEIVFGPHRRERIACQLFSTKDLPGTHFCTIQASFRVLVGATLGFFWYLNNDRVWLSVESAIKVEGLLTRKSQISPYAAMVDHDLLEGPGFQDPGYM